MIRVRQSVINGIILHAIESYPIEACGYLGKERGVIASQYRLRNANESKEHFSFDPEEQFNTVRRIRENKETPGAVYHSHPETEARPSPEDIKLAFDPDILYIIVSLKHNRPDVRCFSIRERQVSLIELKVVSEDYNG